jgi:Amt family ammonium transporter
VAGLVAITPAAGFVTAFAALAIGAVAGLLCHLAAGLKRWVNLDDALDVAAVHLGGGLIGCVCVGLFATTSVNPAGADGLFYSGSYRLLGVQAATAGAVAVYALVATLLISVVVNRVVGQRVRRRQENVGLDLSQHGEAAYDLGPVEPAIDIPNSRPALFRIDNEAPDRTTGNTNGTDRDRSMANEWRLRAWLRAGLVGPCGWSPSPSSRW